MQQPVSGIDRFVVRHGRAGLRIVAISLALLWLLTIYGACWTLLFELLHDESANAGFHVLDGPTTPTLAQRVLAAINLVFGIVILIAAVGVMRNFRRFATALAGGWVVMSLRFVEVYIDGSLAEYGGNQGIPDTRAVVVIAWAALCIWFLRRLDRCGWGRDGAV